MELKTDFQQFRISCAVIIVYFWISAWSFSTPYTKELHENVLYPNTDTEGSHSTQTASLISTHIAQLNFARHSITIHRIYHNSQHLLLSRKENSFYVNCRQTWWIRGSKDGFFAPLFHPLLQLHAESSRLARANSVQGPQGLVWADPAQAPPSKGAWSCQGNSSGNTAMGWIQDKQAHSKVSPSSKWPWESHSAPWHLLLGKEGGNRIIAQVHWWGNGRNELF